MFLAGGFLGFQHLSCFLASESQTSHPGWPHHHLLGHAHSGRPICRYLHHPSATLKSASLLRPAPQPYCFRGFHHRPTSVFSIDVCPKAPLSPLLALRDSPLPNAMLPKPLPMHPSHAFPTRLRNRCLRRGALFNLQTEAQQPDKVVVSV